MWVRKLHIQDVKSFADSREILLGKNVNLLLAPNNAGKTTILRCLYALQNSESDGINYPFRNKRINGTPRVLIELADANATVRQWLSQVEKSTPSVVTKAANSEESNTAL